MVLVDTCVIINYLKNIDDEYTNAFMLLLENKYPFGINNFIYHEVLQGAKSEKEYEILKNALQNFHFYELKGRESYEKAAQINVKCRKMGITIQDKTNLIIAQTAIDNDVMLLTSDRDFYNLAKAVPELKIFEI